ncbi:MAG: sulfatase, partial [Alphaproteobacteria bacterium]
LRVACAAAAVAAMLATGCTRERDAGGESRQAATGAVPRAEVTSPTMPREVAASAGAKASGAAPASPARAESQGFRPANLLLVTVDTLRADHLGFDGYARDTSPRLDALAREGTWFRRCYSQSSTTGASHATLFSSLPPQKHGVYANKQRFPSGIPSLVGELRGHGYATAGFASSVVVGRKFGLQDVFEHFDDEFTTKELNRVARGERPAADTVAAVESWISSAPADKPFFVWMHLIDPHGPYVAPENPDRYVGDALDGRLGTRFPIGTDDFEPGHIPRYQVLDGRTDADYYVARYDAEIRYADGQLGRLFDFLRERGLDRDTLVVITADHGETLAEPGHRLLFSHGNVAYEETSRVPLVVREARGEKRLAALPQDAPVGLIDVAPTVLGLLGFEAPGGFEGRDVVRRPRDPGEPMFTWGAYGTKRLENEIGTQFSVRQGDLRYVKNSADGRQELYDHRDDPTEARDVAGARGGEVERLGGLVSTQLGTASAPAPMKTMTPDHVEALKALGYVE